MAKRAGRKSEISQTSQMLQLFEYLRQQGFFSSAALTTEVSLPLSDVARHIGCTPEHAARLVGMLSCCSQCSYLYVPLYLDAKNSRVLSTGAFSALTQPVRLSAAELRALTEALDLAGIPQNDPLRTKLVSAASEQRRQAEAASDITEEPNPASTSAGATPPAPTLHLTPEEGRMLIDLFSAADQHRIVRISYRKHGSHAAESRRIEPMGFSLERGAWYVHAFCYLRQAPRTFALSRMEYVEVTEEAFEPRNITVERFSNLLEHEFPLATLRIAPSVNIENRDWPGMTHLSTEPDGSRIVRIPYTGSSWLPTRVVSYLGRVEVIEPQGLREQTRRLASERLAASKRALGI